MRKIYVKYVMVSIYLFKWKRLFFLMTFGEDLRQAVVNELGRVDLYSLPFYSKEKRGMIDFLYKNQIIDDSIIEKAFEPAVILLARKDYEVAVRRNLHPDDLGRPEFLAYAINKGEFSCWQLRRLNFDHGANSKTFSEEYKPEKLLSRLREELLNPRPLTRFESIQTDMDGENCADGCCTCSL
jgi:hypothetical protein